MNKYESLVSILSEFSARDRIKYGFSNEAYIGDDVLDLQCIIPVKEVGRFVSHPVNAVKQVCTIVDF